ncbi:carboxypeptidase-like regulatory domain-containing protein [Foetidibacter luteolus]|uniref:carboxypeptidase-like regulatory domain-containing protein n=1 Tax=Foetidibacter luteolus TaxID=2608880 RepID=UPI00129B63BF|nr:carboxypeptidase-like regulatory domain-containing protein [Foetidibacter luteolus]
MITQRRLLTLLGLFAITWLFTGAERDPKLLVGNLQKFSGIYRQEKIHLHLDRSWYFTGDTIYFKAYLVDAENNTPSATSNIMYVDVMNMGDSVVSSLTLPVWDGIAWGSFSVPGPLTGAAFRLRAYTTWMRNFDARYFFYKTVPVVEVINSGMVAEATLRADSGNTSTAIIEALLANPGDTLTNINYQLLLDGKEVKKGQAAAGKNGTVQFTVPASLLTSTSKLQLATYANGGAKNAVTGRVNVTLDNNKKPVISFLPEGGQLVYGLHSKLGFKALGADGLGIDVAGDVFNDSDKKIGSFKSGFSGIGSFEITPFAGNDYYALVNYADGSRQKVKLPKPLDQGCVLFLDNGDDDIIRVQISAANISLPYPVLLVAQSNNSIKYVAKTMLGPSGYSGFVSKKKFPTGIVQFTLFDSALNPLAERLLFVNHRDVLQATINTDKKAYAKREAVQLSLQALDEAGNPVTGSFSVAVTSRPHTDFDEASEKTILSNLLLASDLKGYIESPSYYFTTPGLQAAKDLDNLMLTQGWRRFAWQDILYGRFPALTYKAEKSLGVSGSVKYTNNNPVAGGKVRLISKAGSGFMLDTVTNAAGSFAFADLDVTGDSIPFIVQAEDINGNDNLTVELEQLPALTPLQPDSMPRSRMLRKAAQQPLPVEVVEFEKMRTAASKNAGGLKEVVVKSKILSKTEEAVAPSANLNGPGKADQVLTYMDLRTCNDLGACLQGKLRGVYFKMLLDSQSHTMNIVPFSTLGMGSPMMVILDGMEMNIRQGGASLDNIPPSSIQSIEVLRSGNYLSSYGQRGRGGILIITTKKGGIDYNEGLQKDTKRVFTGSFRAYHQPRVFYSPDYSVTPAVSTADARSTIFWKPDIVTDEYGKAAVKFYNADVTGTYSIILEGISENGQLARSVYHYQVN